MAPENEHVTVREATKDDAPTLLRLMHAAFEEYENVLDPPSAEAAGFAFYEPRGTYLYFSRLSVLPQLRNRGIGRAVIAYVEDRARELGATGVRLGVRLQLPHLVDRYTRLGYHITEYVAHQGYAEPTFVFMEKDS